MKMAGQSKAFPLSFAQQRLWLLDRLVPGLPLYNLGEGLLLEGPLQVPALTQAFHSIVQRHEALRTVFEEGDGGPVQRIIPLDTFALPVIDLCSLPEAVGQQEAARLMKKEIEWPFDLRCGPLFRVTLICFNPRRHQLVMTMHHIVSDGWSMGILNRELAILYEAFSRKTQSYLPDLPIQYVDFAVWQREYLRQDALEGQLEYWRKNLEGVAPLLSLPTDRPRPPVQSFRGGLLGFELGEEATAGLKALGRRLGVTLFAMMLGALKVLLLRYSNETDLAVGTVVAGRDRLEVENLIGFFVNVLILRTDLVGNPTFEELMGRVYGVIQEALSHQGVPFEKLVEELHPERTLGHAPLFQVVASQNTPGSLLELADLHVESEQLTSQTAKFDLAYVVEDRGQRVVGWLEYSTDLFDATTIQRMLSHLRVILEAAGANSGFRIMELSLLQESERHQVLVEWNDSQCESLEHRRLHQLFEAHAQQTPYAVAVISNQGQWSYSELDHEASRFARYLQSRGVGADVLVAMYLERGFELMVALLGILKSGGAYLGLDLQSPMDRLAWVIEDSGVPLVLTTKHMAAYLPKTKAQVICLDRDQGEWKNLSPERLAITTELDHLHCMVYTSGSTGCPKGTLATIRNYLNLLQWFSESSLFDAHSRTLLTTGLNWDASFRTAFTALTRGGATVLADNGPFDPEKILATVANHRVTVANTPMSLLDAVIEVARKDDFRRLSSLEYLYLGGEPVVNAKLRGWLNREENRCQVRNVYGLTETSDVSTAERVRIEEINCLETVPVGRTVRNHRVYVLNCFGEPQPLGVLGEIAIAGEEAVTRGYHARPALTAEKFSPDPFGVGGRLYKTGDLGRLLPDGRLEYRGRVDYQVKVRGMRVELGEIEEQLRQHPRVKEAIVLVKQRTPEDRRLVGYVLLSPVSEMSEEELDRFLRSRLPEFMVPQAFVFLDELPLSASGKVNRKALPEPEWSRAQTDQEYVEPANQEEEELTQIYGQLLGVKRVGAGSHFFALGGHSLLALQLISRVRNNLGVEIPLQRLFQSPTVRELARVVVELADAGGAAQATESIQRVARREDPFETLLVGLQPEGERAPLFCIHSATGSILVYRELAEALGEMQPFYGLQSPDPEALGGPFASIETMAAVYLERLCGVEAERPVVLAGWSLGGLIAFEMARQAKAAGMPLVALVALLDPSLPDLFTEAGTEALTLTLFARNLGNEAGKRFDLPLEELEELEPEEQWGYFLLKARIRKLVSTDSDPDYLRQLYRAFKMNIRAMQVYSPGSYDGSVALFVPRAGLEDAYQTWRQLVKGRLDVYGLPGDDPMSFLRAPYVEALANRLAEAIFTADPTTSNCSPAASAPERLRDTLG